MNKHFLRIGALCLIGFMVYALSIVFDEDFRSEKGSLTYYILIGDAIAGLPLPPDGDAVRYHSFSGDGPSRPFEAVEFTLPPGRIDAAVTLYEKHMAEKLCQALAQEPDAGPVSRRWRCATGEYDFRASPHILTGGTGGYAVHMTWYDDSW